MICKNFKKQLQKYMSKINVLHTDADYDKWALHIHDCVKCANEYMKHSLQIRRMKDVDRFSCVHIPYHLYSEDHYLTYNKSKNEVGIQVPDGGHGYIVINYCFKCGKKIIIKKKK